jgi:hypothetical protein
MYLPETKAERTADVNKPIDQFPVLYHAFMYRLGVVYAPDQPTANRLAVEWGMNDRAAHRELIQDQVAAYRARSDGTYDRWARLADNIAREQL